MRILQAHQVVSAEVLTQANATHQTLVALIEQTMREQLREAAKPALPVFIEREDGASGLQVPGRKPNVRLVGRVFVPTDRSVELLHHMAAADDDEALLKAARAMREELRSAGGPPEAQA